MLFVDGHHYGSPGVVGPGEQTRFYLLVDPARESYKVEVRQATPADIALIQTRPDDLLNYGVARVLVYCENFNADALIRLKAQLTLRPRLTRGSSPPIAESCLQ